MSGPPSPADEAAAAEAADGEVEPRDRAAAFRSTWIVSSLEALRASEHWEDYLASLREHRDEVLAAIAGAWLPMDVAGAHYRACEALGLSSAQVAAMVSRGDIRKAWYAPYIDLAKRAGSPWEILLLLDRMWRRSVDGGAVSIVRLGDAQARIDFRGCELFDIAYFREGVRTVLTALLAHACELPEVRILPQAESGEGCFVAQWT